MRLWARLAFAFFLIGVIPLGIFALFAVAEVQDQAERQAMLDLEQEARLRADRVSQSVEDQAQFLAGWATPYADRLAGMDSELQTALLSAVYVAMPSAVVVALVDADGVAVATPAFSDAVLTELKSGARAEMLIKRAPISEAIRTGTAVGRPYRPGGSRVLSVPVVALATPVGPGHPADEALVIVAEVQLLQVGEMEQKATADRGFALLDETGEVLVGADHPLVDGGDLAPLAQILGTVGNFRLAESDPPLIGGMAAVEGTDWTLVVVRPASVAQAAGTEVWNRAVSIFGFSAALAAFLGWGMSYTMSEPVTKLRDMALSVADGDYGKRTEISRSDEIGELARVFNHMSARLAVNKQEIEEQHEQIVGFNEELQARVDRRTQQLVDAQDQLVRSGQLAAVAEVGAGLAHELNNPLAAILGTAQVLRSSASDETQRTMLGSLEEQAQRCREVVTAMLRFSSGEEVDPANAPVVDLRDVLAEVTSLVRGPFRQRDITLELEMPADPLPVRLDPVHGTRILAQILNGLRAGLTEGTTLQVSAEVDADEIAVVMKPDFPVAIDEFRRDDWMASGMGLWVARRLLDQLGGRMEQPVRVPWVSGMREPATEEVGEDPSLPLLSDATWRVVLPRA